MNIRSTISIIVMLSIFGTFLYWAYSVGKISSTEIIIILLGGIFFVAVTNYIYKQQWSNDDK